MKDIFFSEKRSFGYKTVFVVAGIACWLIGFIMQDHFFKLESANWLMLYGFLVGMAQDLVSNIFASAYETVFHSD